MCPPWLAPLTRPLIVGLGIVLAVAWWLRGGASRNRDDALLVLALALLLRCMLDPWDLVYYRLPLVVALAGLGGPARPRAAGPGGPRHGGLLAEFQIYDARTGMGPYVAYLAWTLPLAAGLGLALFRPVAARRPPAAGGARRRVRRGLTAS